MKPRAEKVAHELQRELAAILRDEIKDPRVGFVTVTRIHLTDDLQRARVWFSCLGDQPERDASLAGLQRAAGFIRKLIAERMTLRLAPEFVFQYDEALDVGNDVLRTLDALKSPPTEKAA